MIDKQALLNCIIDNEKSSDAVLIKELEAVINNAVPFRHSENNVYTACGVDTKLTSLAVNIGKFNAISERVEYLATKYQKRELAFLLGMTEQGIARMLNGK